MADEGRYVYRFLDAAGDGTGATQQTADYSTTAEFFQVDPPDQGFFAIHQMIVQIRSSGMMRAENYGDQPELTNGIIVATIDFNDNIITDFTDGQPIKSNGDWAGQAYDAEMVNVGVSQSGDQFLKVRWSFSDAGQPVYISQGERFAVKLDDDFSGLVSHTAQVQGFFGISARTDEPAIIRIK